jgi:hypothetical protein
MSLGSAALTRNNVHIHMQVVAYTVYRRKWRTQQMCADANDQIVMVMNIPRMCDAAIHLKHLLKQNNHEFFQTNTKFLILNYWTRICVPSSVYKTFHTQSVLILYLFLAAYRECVPVVTLFILG